MRIGLIGLDSSHAVAFTKSFNAEKAHPGLEGFRVVAAFPAGSPDLPASADRIEKLTQDVAALGVDIVDSLEDLLTRVDVVIINSVDGRIHPEQAKAVILAGKPVFIDKPMTTSVREAAEIFALAQEKNVPCFSTSTLRFCPEIAGAGKDPGTGEVLGCEVFSPCSNDPTHPDLFWYGIHGVESLLTVMGPECTSVTCTRTPDVDVVVGVWKEGQVGTFRGIRKGKSGYGLTLFGSKKITTSGVTVSYEPMLVEIAKFFRTGKSPVSAEETLAVLGFMEAANLSHEQGGIPVALPTAAP